MSHTMKVHVEAAGIGEILEKAREIKSTVEKINQLIMEMDGMEIEIRVALEEGKPAGETEGK